MSSVDKGRKENGGLSFGDQLRDIQGEYLMLSELSEKERSYGIKLAETMKMLQYEVDLTIPVDKEPLEKIHGPLADAFLVSESVVVMVDGNGGKRSRPLHKFPPDVMIAVIESCTPELKKALSDKRRGEFQKVQNLEKVLKELRRAQATFKQTRRETVDQSEDSEKDSEASSGLPDAPRLNSRRDTSDETDDDETFAFSGSYQEKKQAEKISNAP